MLKRSQKLRAIRVRFAETRANPRGALVAVSTGMRIPKATDEITREIIAAAIAVHNAFGPGLFERTYIPPLLWDLEDRGLTYVTEVPLSIAYRGRTLERAYLIDILVEDTVVVEVKAVEALLPVHVAQTITYVRLAQKPAGLLINFNVKRLVHGVRRILNDRPSRPRIVKQTDSMNSETTEGTEGLNTRTK